MMKRSLALISLMLLMQFGFAQTSYPITGTVVDAETGEILAGASVQIQGTETGTIAKKNGRFIVYSEVKAPVLIVSYLGYKKRFYRVIRNPLNLIIKLEPDAIQLGTTVITDRRVQLVWPDKKLYIYDYDFHEENLLMVVRDKKKKCSKLVLVNDEDSVLSQHYGVDEEPGAIWRDCFGRRHAVTKNYVCQIYIDEDSIQLFQDPKEDYTRLVKPCKGILDNAYYFGKYKGPHIRNYSRYMEKDKHIEPLHAVVDSFFFWKQIDDAIYAEHALPTDASDPQREAFQAALEARFEDEILTPPVNAPLHIILGQIYIFDHCNGFIFRFDPEGVKQEQIPISYHKEKAWGKEIIIDEEEEHAFTWHAQHGYPVLKEIDLVTGELKGGWDLEKQFVTKIRVRNDVAYFMYKDNNYDPTKRIYSLELY